MGFSIDREIKRDLKVLTAYLEKVSDRARDLRAAFNHKKGKLSEKELNETKQGDKIRGALDKLDLIIINVDDALQDLKEIS